MAASFFPHGRAWEDGNPDTRLESYTGACRRNALTLLGSQEDALRDAVSAAAERHIMDLAPCGQTITIRIRQGQKPEITMEPDA